MNKNSLRLLYRMRKRYQAERIGLDNSIGRKADGTLQNVEEREFPPGDERIFEKFSENAWEQEERIEKELKKMLERFPVWDGFLKGVRGISTITAAGIISMIDIHEGKTVSKIWQYAGLNPGLVKGKKRKNKPDGSFEIEETDTMIRGDKLTPGFVSPFNRELRTLLCGIAGESIIRSCIRWEPVPEETYEVTEEHLRGRKTKVIAGKTVKDCPCVMAIEGPYAKLYIDYKNRLANSSKKVDHIAKKGEESKKVMWKDVSPARRHQAAIRYMVKMFIKDLYANWRALEGLEVRPPYQEEYLGHKHSM